MLSTKKLNIISKIIKALSIIKNVNSNVDILKLLLNIINKIDGNCKNSVINKTPVNSAT